MQAHAQSLEIPPDSLAQKSHVCAFFNSAEEQHRVLDHFIKDGIIGEDKAFHIVDPGRRDEHLQRLADAGIRVEEAVESGQLEVHPWHDCYLHGDTFDERTWLSTFEDVLDSGQAEGYARTRLLAQMEWALEDLPGVENLIQYESELNRIMLERNDTVICAYDLSRFGATTVMNALRTHPVVIIGGLMHENPFYVPPEEFLREMQAR
jgi:hypothetical protein